MELYFGFGIVCNKSELEALRVGQPSELEGLSLGYTSGQIRSSSPLIECIETDNACVAVLKESIRKVDGPVAQPIGISSMNAHHHGYLEEFVHALGSSRRADWIMFRALP